MTSSELLYSSSPFLLSAFPGICAVIILIEAEGYTTIEDLKNWENPFRKKFKRALTGEQLYKILDAFQRCYNIEVVFTTKEKAGADIIRLLNTKNSG